MDAVKPEITDTCIVSEYNHKHDQEMKRVSEWYAKQDIDEKGVSESRKQQEAEQQKKRGLPRNYVASQILKW